MRNQRKLIISFLTFVHDVVCGYNFEKLLECGVCAFMPGWLFGWGFGTGTINETLAGLVGIICKSIPA